MKKLLTFLTLLTLFFTTGWAATVEKTITIDASSIGATSSYSLITKEIGGFTFEIDKVCENSSYPGLMQFNYSTSRNAKVYNITPIPGLKSVTINYNTIKTYYFTYGTQQEPSTNSQMQASSENAGSKTFDIPSGSTFFMFKSETKGMFHISSIVITYEEGGDTPQPTTYSITGTGTQTGGSVTASATSNIAEGTSITITATPSTGYDLSNLTVDGNDVTSSVNSNYEYTFNMPSHDVAVSATFTEQSTPPEPSTDEYELVTNISQLSAGDKIIIANTATAGSGYAISTTQNDNNRAATAVTIANSKITPGNSVQILTLEKEGNNWLFNTGSGYLYAASSSKNWLRTETEPDANGNAEASISISSNAATVTFQGTNTRNILKYNANNGNPIFSCYETSGTVYIYKKVEATPQSNDVYIIGQVNRNGWDTSVGVQMTYSNNNDNYTADIYCTGENSGTDEGYSFFLFAKSLPYDWNNTSNLYGSGADNSFWGIGGSGESAFGEAVPLYEGSKNSYRLAAGLYTITVDLSGVQGLNNTDKSVTVTKRDVTMTISPSSNYFSDTQNVTMASNLTDIGGKIYYTTNGNDPRDQYSGRQEYTGQISISETTTFKAVAYVGNLYSDVVEKTYTKTPAAPVISPASCTFNEPLTVTITAESGATIYYTTDGSTPSPTNGTQYSAPFTVSTTTTVKARAYVGEVYSQTIAEATYTYSNVQPSTGDFVLVTSADQLVAGNEYIIMTTDRDGYKLAMGDLVSKKGTWTQEFDINGNVGAEGSTVSVYSESTTTNSLVNILVLEDNNGSWSLKQKNAGTYLDLSSDKTDINTSSSKQNVTIEINGTYHSAKIQGITKRQILYSDGSEVFANYATSNAGGSGYEYIYLYTRATNTVQPPVFSPISGIYNVDIDVTISCATDGATIYYTTDGTEPSATNGTEYTGEIIVSESTTFKAIAVKGENSSSVVTAAYTIQKSTNIETVTLDYREPFTAGIGKFFITNNTGFSPVWTLDGNFGVKGTSYEPATGTNHAATSRLVSPIIDMTDAVQPEMTFSHQINSFFNDVTTQATLWIRETTNGTSGTWVQLPITFSDPAAAGGWTNDVVDIDLTDVNGVSYAGKKVQISFLYTNPTAGSGAGTWEIQNFVVADNSEYRMVNNIAEFLALENGTKAKFKNPVTVLYDYAQYSSNSYHEYIWVKDESGYMQFFLQPTLNSSTESNLDPKAAYYENGDIIPAGFVVVKNYYENGKYVQAYSTEALDAGFEPATQKGLADPDHYEFSTLNALTLSDADIAANCNRYITVEKVKIASKSGKNFTFANENGTVNACVGYNKYNGDGSLLKDGTTSADVTVPAVSNTYYNVKGIIQIWQGGWEFMPIEFTEWKVDEVTLRKLCADGVENNEYKISNNLMGVFAKGNSIWVKDDTGQSISPDAPDATYKDNFPINAEGNTRLDQALYDQSNWCEIQLTSENAGDFVGKIIKGGSIDGTFTNKTNPTMTGVTLTSDDIYSDGSYEPNYYIPCNFYGNQSCQTSQHGQPGHGDYFFMTPKPQEYAMVVWAIWDSKNEQFVVNENPQYNSHGFQGSFKVDLSLNQNPNIALHDGMDDNFAYNFSAIIRVNSSKAGNDFMVYPLDLSAATDPATAIESVVAGNGEVKSVKFYNVAGIESATPFQGVNIVVTEYTDGSRTTTKMLKK